MQRDSEVRWYHGFIRPKHMLGASFLFHRELRSYEIKNAPHGSHCGGVEAAAEAARRRRRILPNRIFYIADGYVRQSRCLTRKHGGVGERNVEGGNGMRKISGNKLLVKALKEEGVDTLFGYPGACTIDISDELYKQGDIKVILPRHEQALVHEADAYARSTGKVGVCLVTSGPGATIAWLYCPDTEINYPVVQSKDNEYYLRRLLDGTWNIAGTLFMDYRNAADCSDLHTIIYGHNMKNNTMFGSLPKYSKQEYYEEHSVLYLLTPKQNYKVKLIAGYVTPSDSKVYEFEKTKEERSGLLKTALDNSLFTSGTTVSDEDRLLTLSTCSYEYDNARFVLMGILKEIG